MRKRQPDSQVSTWDQLDDTTRLAYRPAVCCFGTTAVCLQLVSTLTLIVIRIETCRHPCDLQKPQCARHYERDTRRYDDGPKQNR